MKKPKLKIETHTTTTSRLCLKAPDLIGLLNNAGYTIPPDAEVTVRIPSGGDYSGMDLDLREVEIMVEYTESK